MNDLAVTKKVAEMSLAEFVTQSSALPTAFRGYQSTFKPEGYKVGDSIEIREQSRANVRVGNVASPQPDIQKVKSLTVGPMVGCDLEYTAQDLSFFLQSDAEAFMEREIRPRIQEIVQYVEADIMTAAIEQLNYGSGDPAANLNSYAVINNARAKMGSLNMPINGKNFLHMDPRNSATLKNDVSNNFNNVLNTDVFFDSSLGRIANFYAFENNSVQTQQAGSSLGTPVLASNILSGNSLTISGLTPNAEGVYLNGDTITVAGVYMVTKIGRNKLPYLMQFVVVGGIEIDGNTGKLGYNASAGGVVTIQIGAEGVISDVSNPFRNVNTFLPAGAPVGLVGAGSLYVVNVVSTARGLDVVVPPIPKIDTTLQSVIPDPATNIYLSVGRKGDLNNMTNLLRIDIQYALNWNSNYAMKLFSAT